MILQLSRFFLFILFLCSVRLGHSQDTSKFDNRTSLSFGLIQPVLGGFNITYTRQVSRFLFAYSHGSLLDLDKFNGIFKSESARKFNISDLEFITTGFDLGFRITPDLSFRGEWKWHLHDLEHPDGEKIYFQTITVGPSSYYQWHPFKGWASQLLLELSIRWWPVVYSSLSNYSYTFTNSQGTSEVFKHSDGNVFLGASIGWTLKDNNSSKKENMH